VAIAGDTLCHGDLRSDNIVLGRAGPAFVDWPHAAVGHPILDLVEWAPSVTMEGGPEPEDLLARHEAWRRADPDVVTVLLAAVAGFFIPHSLQPPPPGLPTLRGFQAAQGEVARAWLARRTGWR
jgi:Phosphotransferase enzyme family